MPQRLKLTQTIVERLRPPAGKDPITYWDLGLPGFGVRVSPLGRKTWIAQYRVKGAGQDGRDVEVRETCGTADKVTFDKARSRARASFELASQGIHPVEQRRLKQAAAQVSAAAQAFTFDKLAKRYLDEYVLRNCRPSTAKQAQRLLARAARTPYSSKLRFGELPASVITRSDIDTVMEASFANRSARAKQAATGGLVEANRLLGVLQRCFKWGRQKRLITDDPTIDMPKPLKKVPDRDRFLTDDEIIAFWSGCDAVGWPFGPLFKLLLLTGQRLTEVAEMPWSELGDLDKRTWTLPKERTKNEKAHEVALSDLAVKILKSLPRFTGGFVFPSEHGDGPVVSPNYAKKKVMEHMAAPDWRLHDLRRTATTGMARLGVSLHVADKILNHKKGKLSGIAGTYNRFDYLPERREALNVWGQHIERLVGANVVEMRTVAAE